jgi:CRISPR system Cascade subunit CasA
MTYSLLDEPTFRIKTRNRESERLSLPELLAAYSADRVDHLVSLRPHQEATFHSFMVSLAFMAMELAGEAADGPGPSTDAARWRELLRGLTAHFPADEPWHLLGEDVRKPAFMQCPCDAAEEAQYTGLSSSPQELDVLVASKSHDVKPGKLGGFGVEHLELWIYALVSLHGDAAYMPAGQKAASVYSSVRKNGAVAARPHFRLAFSRGVGAEFKRDVLALFAGQRSLFEEANACGVGSAPAERLMWLRDWNHHFSASELHPLFLEVCRRVRLERLELGLVVARTAQSSTRGWRTQFDDARGVLADPWSPIARDPKGDKTYNPQTGTGGFGYRRLAPVLFDREGFTLPLLARPSKSEMSKGGTMIARALGRAQGGTDGYLCREVHFPPAAMRRTVDEAAQVALRSQSFIQAASDTGSLLRLALIRFVYGSDAPPRKASPDIVRIVHPWELAFDAVVDEVFFEDLIGSVDTDRGDDEALLDWSRRLQVLAQQVFERAVDSLPTRDRSRAFARARAQGFLRGAMAKRFPGLTAAHRNMNTNPHTAAEEEEALDESK